MSSTLVPEPRVNKLGHTVTKHVRSDKKTRGSSAVLPAPAITTASTAVQVSELSNAFLLDAIGRNFNKANLIFTYDHLELLEGTKVREPSRSLLEALYEASDGIDEQGAVSLLSGYQTYHHQWADHQQSVLEVSARAYKFSRVVDAARLPDETNDYSHSAFEARLGRFASYFFPSEMKHALDPEDVTDLEGAYLLEQVNLNDSALFNTEGAYIRSFQRLKREREVVTSHLPILISAHLIDEEKNYASLDQMMEFAVHLRARVPAEKVESVAQVMMQRGVADIDFIEQAANNASLSLTDGLL